MRMNFGGGVARLGQGTSTMINPFFDLWGPFMAEQVRGVKGMVAYYPANFRGKKESGMHGAAKGFVHGPVGILPGARTR